ncbi:hypothetical protein L3X38_014050 [Prunus dulcis]|uniref:Zinc finger GRF-type domain-containing protein n=1 Tax=Prunus dulcis TaxID=3755 RepID=A0AAD4WPW6_PRUDU|nr:hypothetical protein L3X38_014050 [Prunus dulcis]
MRTKAHRGSSELEDGNPWMLPSQVCYCGKVAKIQTSWTSSHPGRRFYVCAQVVEELVTLGQVVKDLVNVGQIVKELVYLGQVLKELVNLGQVLKELVNFGQLVNQQIDWSSL